MTETSHHGRNVRSIRFLQGMKQELFALKMGVTQQYISKLEKRKKISPDKLQAVAKVLGVPVEAIENFQDTALLFGRTQPYATQPSQSVKEVIDYFKEEIAKKDALIIELQSKLAIYTNSHTLP